MTIRNYSALILVAISVVSLFAIAPFVESFSFFPNPTPLSELYMLGPTHNTTYPFSVSNNQNYRLYIGLINHEEKDCNYEIQVKFRTPQQATSETYTEHPEPSNQKVLTKIPLQLPDNATKEMPLDISFSYEHTDSMLTMNTVRVNNGAYTSGCQIPVDSDGDFYGNLVFELYLLDSQNNSVYKSQVSLWVRLT
ncbi:MAG: DUF1616 domain-containing protein [Candidatus Bathyarchaeota archaeon]|nr:DUF1616 domain-containing protein [Candidatus Bathyarchaeota archaeon]